MNSLIDLAISFNQSIITSYVALTPPPPRETLLIKEEVAKLIKEFKAVLAISGDLLLC